MFRSGKVEGKNDCSDYSVIKQAGSESSLHYETNMLLLQKFFNIKIDLNNFFIVVATKLTHAEAQHLRNYYKLLA